MAEENGNGNGMLNGAPWWAKMGVYIGFPACLVLLLLYGIYKIAVPIADAMVLKSDVHYEVMKSHATANHQDHMNQLNALSEAVFYLRVICEKTAGGACIQRADQMYRTIPQTNPQP